MATDIAKEVFSRFDQLTAELTKAAPVAYGKMVDLMYVKSIAELITVSLATLACVGIWFGVYKMVKIGLALEAEPYGNGEGFFGGAALIGTLNFCFSCFVFLSGWLSTNMWIGLFNPEARLILELWAKVAS